MTPRSAGSAVSSNASSLPEVVGDAGLLVDPSDVEVAEEGARLGRLYADAFPEAYKEDFTSRIGVADIRHMDALEADESTGLNMYQEPGAPTGDVRRLGVLGDDFVDGLLAGSALRTGETARRRKPPGTI